MRFLFVLICLFFLNTLSAGIIIPSDYEKKINNSKLNYVEKKTALTIEKAVKSGKVVLEKAADYLFVQVIPFYAYQGEGGEERLGEDLMGLVGTIKTSENAVIMSLEFKELEKMGLPFKKKIIESLFLDSEMLKKELEVTFFVELNNLTGRVFEALNRIEDSKSLYNSHNRFYRVESKKSKTYFLVHIPNIAYEIAYTGATVETIIAKNIKEIRGVFSLMNKYEPKILQKKELSFDGRYIKGKNISVDLWFLFKYIEERKVSVESVLDAVLKGETVKVEGFEKEFKP